MKKKLLNCCKAILLTYLLATCINSLKAQCNKPPAFSYNSPVFFVKGNAISSLLPTANYSYSSIGTGFNIDDGIAVDGAGNIYVADTYNNLVKKMDPNGNNIKTLGSGFSFPTGIALDASGNIYVVNSGNSKINKMDSSGNNQVTLGSGFTNPTGIALDASGNIYVADRGNNAIKRMDAAGNNITTLGTGFNGPWGVTLDASGNIYVSDRGNQLIKKMDASGNNITTLGSGFIQPRNIAIDAFGDIYVADYNNNGVIMKIAPDGTTVTAVAGGFWNPASVALNKKGYLFIADAGLSKVMKMYVGDPAGSYSINPSLPAGLNFNTTTGVISGTPVVVSSLSAYTITAHSGACDTTFTVKIAVTLVPCTNNTATVTVKGCGSFSWHGHIYTKDTTATFDTLNVGGCDSLTTLNLSFTIPPTAFNYNIPASYNAGTSISSASPVLSPTYISLGTGFNIDDGIAVDGAGNIYVADTYNNLVKKMDPNGNNIKTLGSGFSFPTGIALDASGNIYVVNSGNSKINKMDSSGNNQVTLGSGFTNPTGIALDASGNIYVADRGNNAIKRMDAAGNNITTLGTGFNGPWGVTLDASGNIYVSDRGNQLIKKMDASGNNITTLGSGFIQPRNIAIDAFGDIYVADYNNNGVIMKIAPDGTTVTAVAGGFWNPASVALNKTGYLFIADAGLSKVMKMYVGDPVSNYSIYPPLPAGLNFNTTTGVISGTPAAGSSLTAYTITAHSGGCDTTTSINVAVLCTNSTYSTTKINSCGNYTWNNKIFTKSGSYTDTLKAANSVGCDSIATLNLTINPPPTVYTLSGGGSYCAGGVGVPVALSGSQTSVHYAVFINGILSPDSIQGLGIPLSGTLQTPGVYTLKATDTVTGCIANMNGSVTVILNQPTVSVTTINNCDIYIWHNKTFTTSGVYHDTLKAANSNGCDSITTLNLTINPSVSGNIITPLLKSIPTVTATLRGKNSIYNIYSDNYKFSCTNSGTNDTINLSKNNDVNKTNGVTTLDVALVQSHILAKNILNSPYKIIAADVTGDGKVTALDIVYIKRLILGIDTTFTNSTTKQQRLWDFVDSSYKFMDSTNPFPYKDSISYIGLNTSKTNQTFIGCKLGDVNWDWNQSIARPEINNNSAVELSYNPVNANNEKTIRIPVRVKNFRDMLGIQYTISFNPAVLKWIGIGNSILNFEMGTNHAGEGKISFLWVDAKNEIKTLDDGTVIFDLVFEKTGDCINEQLDIDGSVTSVIAYDKDYQSHNVVFKQSAINSLDTKETWTVSPNPAKDGVIHIQMNLKNNKTLVFRLSDNTGKLILVKHVETVKGNNNFTLNEGNIPAGTYYLQVIGVDGIKEVKQIMVN